MVIFLDLLVLALCTLLVVILATQILYPIYTGEPLFPLFRKSSVRDEISKAERALEEVTEENRLKEIVS